MKVCLDKSSFCKPEALDADHSGDTPHESSQKEKNMTTNAHAVACWRWNRKAEVIAARGDGGSSMRTG